MGAAAMPQAMVEDAYSYSVEWTGATILAAGQASNPQDVTVQADADFYCTSMTGVAGTTLVAGTAFAPILVVIRGSASGEDWSDRPVHFLNYFGRGDARDFFPYHVKPPRIMKRNSTTRVTLTNLDVANAFNVRITFHGFRRYGVS